MFNRIINHNSIRFFTTRDIYEKIKKNSLNYIIKVFLRKVKTFSSLLIPLFLKKFWSVLNISKNNSEALYAFYDLNVSPSTFDICKFLVLAETERIKKKLSFIHLIIVACEHNGIKKNKDYDLDALQWRLRNILIPSHSLLPTCCGITVCNSRREAGLFFFKQAKYVFPTNYLINKPKRYYSIKYIKKAVEDGSSVDYLTSTPQAKKYIKNWIKNVTDNKKIVTITLREVSYDNDRNSNLNEWSKFVQNIDKLIYFPVIIRDIEKSLLPLPDCFKEINTLPQIAWSIELRMALYELSYLNLTTNNGPSVLLFLNRETKFLTFFNLTDVWTEKIYEANGIKVGEQHPTCGSFRKIVWNGENYETIKKEFDQMCQKIEAQSLTKEFAKHDLQAI